MMEELLESSQRNQSSDREKEKRQANEAVRTQEALRDFKDNNR